MPSAPRRVLMTADTVGGVWQYGLHLSSLLATRDVRVCLATMGREPTARQRADAAAIAGLDLRTSTFALEWMPSPWADVDRAGEWLLQLAAEFAPDIVHVNGFAHAALPWREPVLLVAHSCVSSWWQAVRQTDPPVEWCEYIRRVKAGLASATAIAAPTRAMRDALVHCYGAGERASVIPNCCSLTPPSIRKEPLIFAAGRVWDAAKNLMLLDTVAPDLSWPVYIAGDNTSPDGATPGPLTRARLLGARSQSEVTEWMGRASVYAFPARYEPFGLSILEAALSECALVLGDIASLRENWDGVARFVAPDSPDALRCALNDLIDHPTERIALAQAARRRAQTFSPPRHLDAYIGLYQETVNAHAGIAHSARSH